MSDWALATTPPNAEHLVSADLTRFGYEHLLFKRRATRVRQGRIILAMPPAFPRYIMIPFGECWDVLRNVWRVLGIVCFGEEIARVHQREVDALVARCGGGDVLPALPIVEPYAHGERVHIGGLGLASGHEALFENSLGDGKLRLLFDFMGRMVPIDVDQRDVFSIVKKPKRGRRHRRRSRRNHTLRTA